MVSHGHACRTRKQPRLTTAPSVRDHGSDLGGRSGIGGARGSMTVSRPWTPLAARASSGQRVSMAVTDAGGRLLGARRRRVLQAGACRHAAASPGPHNRGDEFLAHLAGQLVT
jgi:hypothetical protein